MDETKLVAVHLTNHDLRKDDVQIDDRTLEVVHTFMGEDDFLWRPTDLSAVKGNFSTSRLFINNCKTKSFIKANKQKQNQLYRYSQLSVLFPFFCLPFDANRWKRIKIQHKDIHLRNGSEFCIRKQTFHYRFVACWRTSRRKKKQKHSTAIAKQ